MKKKKNQKETAKENSKRVIDLTSYISQDMIKTDVDGSYTGVPEKTYFEDVLEEPVQDADDL